MFTSAVTHQIDWKDIFPGFTDKA